MNRYLPLPSLVSALLAGTLLPAPTEAQQYRRDREYESRVDTTITFDRNGIVSLSIGDGEIIVTAWNQDRVRVRATSERGLIRLDATAARLSLELSRPRGGDTRFEVTVPVGARVSARATTGDVTVMGTKGPVEATTQSGDLRVEDATQISELRTMSGDITARGLAGAIDVGSMNGDITITDARGDVEVSSVSGDIELHSVISKFVRAKSTGGDVSFDGAIDAAGRYELGSHSGDVFLIVPQSIGALLTVATFSGSIDSDFPITLKPGEHIGTRRLTFEVGKGDARISAETFSGDVTIRTRGRTTP